MKGVIMSHHTVNVENAARAKEVFGGLMKTLHVRVPDASAGEFENIFMDERASEELEMIEPMLAGLSAQYGFQYQTPTLSDEGKTLITNSPEFFLKHYERRLRRLDMDPLGILYI